MKFSTSQKTPNNARFFRPNSWKAFTLSMVTIISSLGLFTGTAYAGLFSFVESFFEGNEASAKIINSSFAQSSQSIALLQAATNPDPNPNKIADTAPVVGNALIPDIAATNNATDPDQTSAKISTYTVRSGDTVSGIAKMFNVSVSTVLWANNLTSKSVLQAGKTLVILPVSGAMYTVKKGDTVEGIAKQFKADASDIVAYNDLTITSLAIGQTIIIPNAEFTVLQSSSQTTAKSDGTSKLLDNVSGLPSLGSYFLKPIYGGIKTQGLHGHNGVDIGAPVGTPIVAAAGGTVIISRMNGGWNGGYGNYVVISHSNGTQTLYSHLQTKTVVVAGETVDQGQTIGYVGMTGLTTGAHLHFEVRGAKNPF